MYRDLEVMREKIFRESKKISSRLLERARCARVFGRVKPSNFSFSTKMTGPFINDRNATAVPPFRDLQHDTPEGSIFFFLASSAFQSPLSLYLISDGDASHEPAFSRGFNGFFPEIDGSTGTRPGPVDAVVVPRSSSAPRPAQVANLSPTMLRHCDRPKLSRRDLDVALFRLGGHIYDLYACRCQAD